MDMGVLDGLDVPDRAIGHITGDLIGPVTPSEEHPACAGQAWDDCPSRAVGTTRTARIMRRLPPSTT